MKYVRFQGTTRFPNSTYKTYLIFEDEIPEDIIKRENTELAIENAKKFKKQLHLKTLPEDVRNTTYLTYLQECIDNASYNFVSSEEFFFNIED